MGRLTEDTNKMASKDEIERRERESDAADIGSRVEREIEAAQRERESDAADIGSRVEHTQPTTTELIKQITGGKVKDVSPAAAVGAIPGGQVVGILGALATLGFIASQTDVNNKALLKFANSIKNKIADTRNASIDQIKTAALQSYSDMTTKERDILNAASVRITTGTGGVQPSPLEGGKKGTTIIPPGVDLTTPGVSEKTVIEPGTSTPKVNIDESLETLTPRQLESGEFTGIMRAVNTLPDIGRTAGLSPREQEKFTDIAVQLAGKRFGGETSTSGTIAPKQKDQPFSSGTTASGSMTRQEWQEEAERILEDVFGEGKNITAKQRNKSAEYLKKLDALAGLIAEQQVAASSPGAITPEKFADKLAALIAIVRPDVGVLAGGEPVTLSKTTATPETSTSTEGETETNPKTSTSTETKTGKQEKPEPYETTTTKTATPATTPVSETTPSKTATTGANVATPATTATDTPARPYPPNAITGNPPITIEMDDIIKKPPIPGSKGDLEIRRKIKKKDSGAIAWRMGELNGKDRYDVIVHPYTKRDNYYILLGKKPAGAVLVKGPQSARKTAKVLFGKTITRKIMIDNGIIDVNLEPLGKNGLKIGFTPDPKQLTTGDFSVTKKAPFPLERKK